MGARWLQEKNLKIKKAKRRARETGMKFGKAFYQGRSYNATATISNEKGEPIPASIGYRSKAARSIGANLNPDTTHPVQFFKYSTGNVNKKYLCHNFHDSKTLKEALFFHGDECFFVKQRIIARQVHTQISIVYASLETALQYRACRRVRWKHQQIDPLPSE